MNKLFSYLTAMTLSLGFLSPPPILAQLGGIFDKMKEKTKEAADGIGKAFDPNKGKPDRSKGSQPAAANSAGQSSSGDLLGVAATVGGLVGVKMCVGKNASQARGLLCTVGIGGAAFASKLLGDVIVKELKERDQRKAVKAASDTLRTGEPKTIQLPDSQAAVTITPVDQPVYKEVESEILIDRETLPDIKQTLKGIGTIHKAIDNATIYSMPSQDAKTFGQLKSGEALHVMGKVSDQPWMLIARMVETEKDFPAAPMGVGFVGESLLVESQTAEPETEKTVPKATSSVKVKAVLKCQSNTVRIVKDNGEIHEREKMLQCLGLDGVAQTYKG